MGARKAGGEAGRVEVYMAKEREGGTRLERATLCGVARANGGCTKENGVLASIDATGDRGSRAIGWASGDVLQGSESRFDTAYLRDWIRRIGVS
ncbi:hypothetical protein Tco_1506154 [Tanacetum coccineum]